MFREVARARGELTIAARGLCSAMRERAVPVLPEVEDVAGTREGERIVRRVASGILLLCMIHAGTAVADQPRPATRSADLTIESGARRFQSIDAQGGQALVRDLKFTHLTTSDGLSQGYVAAILQDRRGFMWFATRDGLNRYDGKAFVVYKHNPKDPGTLDSNFLQDLIEDDHGHLWISTNTGVNKLTQ